MGAGTSALPSRIDQATAKSLAGDEFDESAFNAAAVDGTVSRDAFMQAAGLATGIGDVDDDDIVDTTAMRSPSNFLASNKNASSAPLKVIDQHKSAALEKEMVTAALSLCHVSKGDAFLGAETRPDTDAESLFAASWKAIGTGDFVGAIATVEQAIAMDNTNEKLYYTRALCYARTAQWRYALADYSHYLKLTKIIRGPQLANAYYSRALCLAKLGHRLAALRDLDSCIRVGPTDEQANDEHASLVPLATIARYAMVAASPDLGAQAAQAAKAEAAAQQRKASAAAGAAAAEEGGAADTIYEGTCWQVAITDLETAVERALRAGRTPLLLDRTREKAVDQYYLYAPATVIEAKRVVLEARVANMALDTVRESLRLQLVRAMRWGHTLLVRMTNTAADFENAYCHDEYFPKCLFDVKLSPAGKEASSSDTWSRVLRPADLSAAKNFVVPASFRVVLSSAFGPDSYDEFLRGSLPMSALQPCHIIDPTKDGASSSTLLKGQTKEGQLTGDRTSLVLQGWGLKAGPDENPAGRPTGIGGAKTDGSFNIIPA